MNPVVEASELTRWYGQVIAVNRVSVAVPPGITALLGPNGAGKSTFLKMCTGQMRQSRGELRVLGEPVWNNERLFRRIGLSPEHDRFHEDMTGLQFVTVMAKLAGFGWRAAKKRAGEILDRVGLDDARLRAVRTYSKGMRQRTKLAQALLHEPDLIFLDEPMNGLDPVARYEIQQMIREIADQGGSVIVSTHILHEVESLTDQMLLMANGRVIAEGDVHEIREELEDHPYAIEVLCDRPRRVAELLLSRRLVDGAEIHDDDPLRPRVIVQTTKAGEIFSLLPQLLVEEGIRVEGISSPDDNIEAVFEYLVHG